jgi:hypothetical protein
MLKKGKPETRFFAIKSGTGVSKKRSMSDMAIFRQLQMYASKSA